MFEAVILAAGQSRRMGGVNKLLLPVAGEAMVRRTVRLYLAVAGRITVVLGHQADAVAEALAGLDVRLVMNPDYAAGHAGSARAGLAALRLDGAGVIVALADQPLLTVADVQTLLLDFDGQHILIPRYQGQRGNPVLFPSHMIREIVADPARHSPRTYCDQHPESIRWHEADHTRFTTDIDTPEAAKAILSAA